jgi:hypothetical protein
MSVIVKLLSKFDDSGIKKAKGSFGGLKKTIGAIGIGIGISQITNLLMESAKAASADQKSTQLLNTQLVRNAGATKAQIKQSDKFIENLSLQTGIFDDDLRPAYGKFARVTKDVNKAQDLLTLSLDASATTGKPLEKVSNAISQAFVGNRKQLEKLFPSLKTSKDLFGDLEKIVGGAAIQQADPFSKFNNSMDILKEKLGNAILPLIEQFVTEITKPGGLVEQVGKFLEDLSNPKTKPGKMFEDIKNAVKDAFGYVKDFFALFGNGDAMKGFGNVAGALVKMLPALIALKGIMMLANAGKSIANLVKAMSLIAAGNAAGGGGGVTPLSKLTKNGMLSVAVRYAIPLAVTIATLDVIDAEFSNPKNRKKLATAGQKIVAPSKFLPKAQKGVFVDKNGYDSSGNFVGRNDTASNKPINNGPVTVNVYSTNADPKAVVDAVSKYVKTNGGVPSAWGLSAQFHGSGR